MHIVALGYAEPIVTEGEFPAASLANSVLRRGEELPGPRSADEGQC
jgi:hypothetical protein